MSRGNTPEHYSLLVVRLHLRHSVSAIFKNKSTVVLHLQSWFEIHFLSVGRILLTNRSVIQEIPSQLPTDTTVDMCAPATHPL
jgi:hypothetical protein